MATAIDPASSAAAAVPFRTVADLVHALGDIPPERILLHPPPGTATEEHVTYLDDHEDRLCELIDGVLVEKTMGFEESCLGLTIARLLGNFVVAHKLGRVAGADATLRILPGQVRLPDVCFIAKEKFLQPGIAGKPIPALAPDLAVEVLSASNTRREMQRKLRDYFAAGTRLVWYVEPPTKTVEVFTAVELKQTLTESDTLTGGDVLPGFAVAVRELFDDLG
jgi:Uma2 family endonuclease